MNKSKLKLTLVIIITVVAFLIAIPTIIINDNVTIRGFNPEDISNDFVVDKFGFKDSVDLNGGQIVTYNVDLSTLGRSQADIEFSKIKDILSFRLSLLNIGEYDLTSLVSNDGEYKLILKVQGGISENQLKAIVSRGQAEFWLENNAAQNIVDEEGNPIEIEDPNSGTPFEDRSPANITNYDIFIANVVADSRVYLANLVVDSLPDSSIVPENSEDVSNYGISVRFTPEANLKLLNALASNPIGVAPVMVTLDGSPVAYQASGNTYAGSTTADYMLLYTLLDDNVLDNSILASLLSSPVVPFEVQLEKTSDLEPTLGVDTLDHIKLSLGLGFVLLNAVLVYYFRSRSKLLVASNVIFLIWSVAVLKIFGAYGLALSFPLILGYLVSLLAFVSFMILIGYRIRTKFQSGFSKSEALEVFLQSKNEFRNLTILFVISAFALQRYGTITLEQYANGLGFGFIVGLLFMLFALPIILPFTFKLGKK